ncbi:MAG: pknD 2 [Mucilaginibacter sp.]|nr:pknD 2 [Mucilaginibacter sp.]
MLRALSKAYLNIYIMKTSVLSSKRLLAILPHKISATFFLILFGFCTNVFADGISTNKVSSVTTLNSLSFNPTINKTTVAGAHFRDYTATVQNSVNAIKVIPVATDANATIKVNGVPVLSGSTSASIPLHVGTNTITTRVTATDGVTSNLYSIVITRLVPATATLNSLSFSPNFARVTVPGLDFRDYMATVPSYVSTVSVIPVTTDPASTVKVNGITAASGTATPPISLAVGSNTITTVVTASDGITTNVYSIVITRPVPPVATLYALYFSPTITRVNVPGADFRDYTATVPAYVTSITVTPVTTDVAATVIINGVKVASAIASKPIKLNVGPNVIKAVVTASDGVTKLTYGVTITRLPDVLLKSFRADGAEQVTGPDYRDYAATVSSLTTTYFVTPVAHDPTSTIKVNGIPVLSGNDSPRLPLNTGSNTITTVVTAADSVTKATYKVVVTRLAAVAPTLSKVTVTSGKPLVRVTGPDFRDYTTSVDSSVVRVEVRAVLTVPDDFHKGRLTINGTLMKWSDELTVFLKPGINIITIKVTGEDTTASNIYKITLSKPHMETLAGGNPVFARDDGTAIELKAVTGTHFRNLTGFVPSFTTKALLNIKTEDPAASVKVNGVSGSSPGVFSNNLNLNVGVNTFNIIITSYDGLRSNTYNVVITRERPGYDATLASNYWGPDLWPPLVDGPDEKDWVWHVFFPFSSIQAIAIPDDSQSTMKINGILLQSNAASTPIPLKVGVNIISIVVTSRNGLNSKTYKLALTRFAEGSHVLAYTEDQVLPVINNVIVVHENLSPNGDGIGDFLQIDGIAGHPDNKLTIIDRSGALVYEARGYDNVLKVFDGRSSVNGKLQQAGTYFYSLTYKAGAETKYKTGFIMLKY